MKKHIDRSPCNNRSTMPKKSQIAFYWHKNVYDYFNYEMDWGEPSCWACGIWNENCPDLENPKADIKDTFEFWNKHNYLERCHIIPSSHGGCNCEANLVILCKECHKASPDTKSPITFQTWVKNRDSWFQLNTLKLTQVSKELAFELGKYDYKIMFSEEFKEYFFKNAIPVGGKFALSTRIACLIEFKEQISEIQLEKIYEEYDKKNKLNL